MMYAGEVMKAIGSRMTDSIRKSGMSFEMAAMKAGWSQSSVRDVAHGDRCRVNVQMLMDVAEAVGADWRDWLNFKEEK